MNTEKIKLAKYYTAFQLILFVIMITAAGFVKKPDSKWLFVLIPLSLWALLCVQVFKERLIDFTMIVLLFMFTASIMSLIEMFHYLNIFALVYHLFFIR